MELLLDTNVVSELRRLSAGGTDAAVAAWNARVDPRSLWLSCISLLELEVGVQRAERQDRPAGATLRAWLDADVQSAFEGRVLPVSMEVATRAASLHVPDPAPQHDALIAATALVHGLTMVTRNARDFARFAGLEVLDPWAWDG